MNLYFIATVLHAAHLTIGVCLLLIAAANRRARCDPDVVLIGNVVLYWHVVDIVWTFLYPTLYLPGVK
jgi:cytochrome c oxidase subunit 3